MNYIFMEFEDCKYWLELDEDGYALRQIISDNDETIVSCRDDCLAEGMIDTSCDCEIINHSDFEKMWEQATQPIREEWEIEKQEYPVSCTVSGKLKYFYPQGAIFELGNIQGCANISDYTGVYPGFVVSGIVTAYDDVNMWVLIDECTVMPEPTRSVTITREKCRFIGSLIKYYCFFNIPKGIFKEHLELREEKYEEGEMPASYIDFIKFDMEQSQCFAISNGKSVSVDAGMEEHTLFVVAFTSTNVIYSDQITIPAGELDLSYRIKTKYDFSKGTTLLLSEG